MVVLFLSSLVPLLGCCLSPVVFDRLARFLVYWPFCRHDDVSVSVSVDIVGVELERFRKWHVCAAVAVLPVCTCESY